jgi:hypothetical protein
MSTARVLSELNDLVFSALPAFPPDEELNNPSPICPDLLSCGHCPAASLLLNPNIMMTDFCSCNHRHHPHFIVQRFLSDGDEDEFVNCPLWKNNLQYQIWFMRFWATYCETG